MLLLGDSFSNIYCTTDLGWGEAAGFPAQLYSSTWAATST